MAAPVVETDIPSSETHAELLRSVCSRFPAGITITTTRGVGGEPHGIYASSFIRMSLHPPLVLVCIDRRAQILKSLAIGECFGVNVLSEPQRDHSMQASASFQDRFTGVSWRPGITGVPLLLDIPAIFECKTVNMIPTGGHVIVIGEVLHVVSAEYVPLTHDNP